MRRDPFRDEPIFAVRDSARDSEATGRTVSRTRSRSIFPRSAASSIARATRFSAPTAAMTAGTVSAKCASPTRQARRGMIVPLELPIRGLCRGCGGRGEVWTEPCAACSGSGHSLVRHPIRVSVPQASATAPAFVSRSRRRTRPLSVSNSGSRSQPDPAPTSGRMSVKAPQTPEAQSADSHVDLVGVLFMVWGSLTILIGASTLALGMAAASLISAAAEAGRGQFAASLTAATFTVFALIAIVWGAATSPSASSCGEGDTGRVSPRFSCIGRSAAVALWHRAGRLRAVGPSARGKQKAV